jgi:branched-subunit amino acid transport protein
MSLATFGQRASFLLLPEHVKLPLLLRQALRYVPAAVLTAIWAPELLLQKGVLSLALENERLLAGIVAVGVAWRFRATFVTIVAGLVALHLFDWMF